MKLAGPAALLAIVCAAAPASAQSEHHGGPQPQQGGQGWRGQQASPPPPQQHGPQQHGPGQGQGKQGWHGPPQGQPQQVQQPQHAQPQGWRGPPQGQPQQMQQPRRTTTTRLARSTPGSAATDAAAPARAGVARPPPGPYAVQQRSPRRAAWQQQGAAREGRCSGTITGSAIAPTTGRTSTDPGRSVEATRAARTSRGISLLRTLRRGASVPPPRAAGDLPGLPEVPARRLLVPNRRSVPGGLGKRLVLH